MNHIDHNVVWGIAVAVLGIGGYAYGWFSRPKQRPGCTECAADLRREQEKQRELNHDYAHEHGFGCADKDCKRNKPGA